MKSGVQHLLDVGRPVPPHDPLERIKARRLPVRVVDHDASRVIHVPISEWGVGDVAALRQIIEALGFAVVENVPSADPDGCVLTLRRANHAG